MIIKRITLRNLGSVESFSYDLTDGINRIKNRATDELSYAIRLILNHRVSRLPKLWVSGSTKIEALVRVSEKDYLLIATPDPNRNNLCLRILDEHGNEKTREYLYLTAHCPEQDLCEVFDADAEKQLLKLIQYFEEDRYFPSHALSRRTDRLSETKSFRAYLKTFIKEFKSETIRDGKRYELCLKESGRYSVQYKDDHNDTPVFLSESEQTLFRYLCFLRTAEFWQGFEELRNLHHVKKPILIGNFLERLDESINIQELLKRTSRLRRQIILLTV